MDARTLKEEIVSFCMAHSDEAIVKKHARYFKESAGKYDAYGVSSDLIEEKVKELSHSPIEVDLLMETAPALLESGKYEETFFIILLVERQLKKLKAENFDSVSQWFEYGIVNWAHCDTLCNKITPYFFLQKLVPLSRLAEWQNSSFQFKRRAVPVSLIKLLKSTGDYTPFFELISPLMMDTERVVHQGLGWFLREAWKKQPLQTERFLLDWKDQSARLIFQYATEKMNKEGKLKFKKVK